MAITGPDDGTLSTAELRERLARSERGLRQLAEVGMRPTLLLRHGDEIVLANAAVETLLGHAAAGLVGTSIDALVAPAYREESRARRRGLAAMEPIGPIATVRAALLTRDGRPLPVEIQLSGIETAAGRLVAAALRDISGELLRERQDAALHRIAASSPAIPLEELLGTVVAEAAALLRGDRALVARFDPDAVVVVGCHGDPHRSHVGDVIALDSGAALATVARTGAVARLDYADLHPGDPMRELALQEGRRHAVAVPISVHNRIWGGLMVAGADIVTADELDALQRFAELAGVLIGASEARAAERALRDSEERFRLLSHFVPQLLWTCDGNGDCDFVNLQWTEYTGLPAERLHGHGWLDAVHPDDVRELAALWDAARVRAEPFAADFRIRRHDGEYRRVDTRATPEVDDAGVVVKWFGSNTDVEEARAAEQSVRESEAWARAALEAGRMGAWSHDLASGRTDFDRQCRRLLSMDEDLPAEEVRLRLRALIDPEDLAGLDRARDRAAEEADPRPYRTDFRIDLPGAGRRWLSGHSSLTFDSAGCPRGLIGVMADVTAEREAGERALRSQKLEAIGTLAGGIAHDFNNLLQVVGGNVALAQAALPAGNAAEEHLGTAERATRRAADLVERILSFSRPDEGARREPVNVEALVADALALLRPTLPAMVELRATSEPDLPAVLGDRVAITQVVTNLATNAAQAIGRRAGVVEFRAERLDLTAEDVRSNPDLASGDYVRLTVGDDGPGMDATTLARVFDPFFTTKEPGSGTGLGLSIVHSVMRAHGGAVTAYSVPGHGAAFHLYVPVATAPPAAPPAVRQGPGGVAAPERGARVLFVDDEADLVALHERSLARAGHSVTGHTDPRAALEAFRAAPSAFDAVVTDLSMPGMTGIDLARELLTVRPGIPILIASGYIPAEERAEAAAIGVRGIIPKPSPIAHLREALAAALQDGGPG